MSSESSRITRSDLVDLQQKDKYLAKPFIFAKTEKRFSSGRGQYSFEFDDGLLVSVFQSPVIQYSEKIIQVITSAGSEAGTLWVVGRSLRSVKNI